MDRRAQSLALLVLAGVALLPATGAAGPATPPPPPPATRPQPRGDVEPPSNPPSKPAPPPPSSATTTPPAPAAGTTTPPPPPSGAPTTDDAAEEPPAEPVDLSDTWGYARSSAPRPRYVRRSTDPILYAPNPIGYYSGVSVDGNEPPPRPVDSIGRPPAVLTWAGFERTPTGSRVFFQLSDDAAFEVTQKGTTIVVRMKKTKINVRNNMRALDLRYFKTPVRSVKVSRKGKDTVGTIVLDRNTTPTSKMITGKRGSGYKLIVLEFTHPTGRKTEEDRPNVPKKYGEPD
jgi:hypothetical protein